MTWTPTRSGKCFHSSLRARVMVEGSAGSIPAANKLCWCLVGLDDVLSHHRRCVQLAFCGLYSLAAKWDVRRSHTDKLQKAPFTPSQLHLCVNRVLSCKHDYWMICGPNRLTCLILWAGNLRRWTELLLIIPPSVGDGAGSIFTSLLSSICERVGGGLDKMRRGTPAWEGRVCDGWVNNPRCISNPCLSLRACHSSFMPHSWILWADMITRCY